MSLAARRACGIALVVLGAVYVAWLGFRHEWMGDYPGAYAPAMNSLLAGHLSGFLAHLPADGDGGSLLLRAPGALLGKLIVGGQLAEFRFGALLCVLATGSLGLWLARELRQASQPVLARACVIAVCVLSPAVLDAIFFGHPEEALGAALCVAAVLLAGAQRSTLAGVVLGLAVINKPWGVLAVAPVLLCARERRIQLALVAGAVCLGWAASAYLADPHHFARIASRASTSGVAHPVDLWWPLARLRHVPGVTPAYFPPSFLAAHARQLVVLLVLPLSLLLLRRGDRSTADCLALLALLFLLRCLLDPSNHVYYQLPLVITLAAWEARLGKAPLFALGATAGFWLVFHTISGTGSLSGQFAAYLVVALPLALVLGIAVCGGKAQLSDSLWRGRSALGWAR